MIFEKYIKKETAIYAKERGFDEECDYLWGVVDGYEGQHKWTNINHLCNERQFSAPTQAFLQEWLREKHGIEVFVKPFVIPQLNKKGSIKYHGLVMTVDCIGDCNVGTECKDKYEDAFEDALVLALNLLKDKE